MPDPTPAAPAQPETPTPTVSAAMDAASKGDLAAFEAAHLAGKRGTPLPDVPKPADAAPVAEPVTPAAPETPERGVSKRQEKINEYERTIAELRAENARLAVPARPAAPRSDPRPQAQAPTPPANPEPDPNDTAKYPEGQFDRQFLKDQARWEARELLQAELAARDRRDATQYAEQQIAQQVDARLHAAHAKGIDVPALLNAPLPIDPSMPGYGSISGVIVRSDLQVELMQHFVAHPEEATRIAQLPPGAAFREVCLLEGRLHARMDAAPDSPPAAPAPPSTITAAPPPAPVLTRPAQATDPKSSAMARGDFDAFNQAELAARVAKRGA